jgi:hypothetical protein
MSRKQKELFSVMVVLRGEGVNIERIYRDVLNGSVEVPENDAEEVAQSIRSLRREDRRIYKQLKALPTTSDIDADNSSTPLPMQSSLRLMDSASTTTRRPWRKRPSPSAGSTSARSSWSQS